MIVFNQVSKEYPISPENIVQAVSGLNLTVKRGEFLVITGRSGSGKTTLLNLAAGLTRPTSGTVCFEGIDLWTLSDVEISRLRNQKIGFIFQFPSLISTLNVLENVLLPGLFLGNHQSAYRPERAAELLELVGLADKLKVFPRQLSAGQQQRVVIARSLINRPEVLMADEPTSNLDEFTEGEIMDLFRRIFVETGIAILMVTHTRQLVGYGTRSLEMAAGKMINEMAAA